jgi:hypothetical protein
MKFLKAVFTVSFTTSCLGKVFFSSLPSNLIIVKFLRAVFYSVSYSELFTVLFCVRLALRKLCNDNKPTHWKKTSIEILMKSERTHDSISQNGKHFKF